MDETTRRMFIHLLKCRTLDQKEKTYDTLRELELAHINKCVEIQTTMEDLEDAYATQKTEVALNMSALGLVEYVGGDGSSVFEKADLYFARTYGPVELDDLEAAEDSAIELATRFQRENRELGMCMNHLRDITYARHFVQYVLEDVYTLKQAGGEELSSSQKTREKEFSTNKGEWSSRIRQVGNQPGHVWYFFDLKAVHLSPRRLAEVNTHEIRHSLVPAGRVREQWTRR